MELFVVVDAREILSDCILYVVENMHYLRSWPLAWTLEVSVICLWGAGGAGRREREREKMKTWLPARAGCSRNANVHQYPCPLFVDTQKNYISQPALQVDMVR